MVLMKIVSFIIIIIIIRWKMKNDWNVLGSEIYLPKWYKCQE